MYSRALCILLVATAPAWGVETAKPNELTATEQSAGWLLLFDGATSFGWKIDGTVSIDTGRLIVGGKNASMATTTSAFADGELQFQYRQVGTSRDAEVRVKGPSRGLPANRDTTIWVDAIVRIENGKLQRAFPSRNRNQLQWFDDTGAPNSVGPISFVTAADAKLEIRNIRFKPLGLTPVFNGKNLNGWKVFAGDPKRAKSRFSVNQEGCLHVANGPGDIQTEGQWADFVLQLECISNGAYLNSGIFFRCLPNQYQQGYEVQIRNQWQGEDRTKPVDFGTGAIYRRQAARKVVATDREWFTLTLITHGTHMATWVNGFPVVDFADVRPKNENARNGAKLDKGPISIQGHDPTTDLSFRNVRLAEYRK